MNIYIYKKHVGLGLLAVLLAGGLVFSAKAQTADDGAYITWRARTYVPGGYAGRPLPTANSPVTAGVILVRDGKVADLAGENIYWYLNNKLFASGAGLQKVSFNMPEVVGGTVDLRAEVGGEFLKTITLQAVSPRIVIEPFLPDNQLTREQITFRAVPYFFNAPPDRLSYDWLINNEPPDTSEAPRELTLTVTPGTPSGFQINLRAVIRNARHAFESAAKNMSLIFNP